MNRSDRAILYDDLAINFSVYMRRKAEEYEWFSFSIRSRSLSVAIETNTLVSILIRKK